MKKSILLGILWSMWLTYWLTDLGVNVLTLKFWLIYLPIIMIAGWETIAAIAEQETKNKG